MGFEGRIKPKRSLGQNFFVNKSLEKYIVDIVLKTAPIHITEIGPGKGAFTKHFYVATKNVVVIERDEILASALKSLYTNIHVHAKDFLDIKLTNKQTTYFGSLPYNMSKPIIRKIITSDTFTKPAFFIIQKEVAQKYSNLQRNQLGLIREIYSDFKTLLTIKPDSFSPKPNVMSAFVQFTPHNKFPDLDKPKLEKLIVQAFNQPRKTLKNNLKGSKYVLASQEEMLRPDQLTLEQYISILNRS